MRSAEAESKLQGKLAAGMRLLSMAHLASKYEAEKERLGESLAVPDAVQAGSQALAGAALPGDLPLLPEMAKFRTHYSKVGENCYCCGLCITACRQALDWDKRPLGEGEEWAGKCQLGPL